MGTETVAPETQYGHSIEALLQSPVTADNPAETKKPLYKRLLEAAQNYLKEAGIYFPHATLQVRGDIVVMHGAPQCGELLVCALEGPNVRNYV